MEDSILAQWNNALGRAIVALGTPDFGLRLTQAIRGLVAFDNIMLFVYRGEERPLAAYTDVASSDEALIIMGGYITGPYLLDPYFTEVLSGRVTGLARLSDIAPDRFFETEYFKRHYIRTGIIDEVGFFMGLPDGVTAVLSITKRGTAQRFTPKDLALLHDIAPAVSALGAHNWMPLYKEFETRRNGENRPGLDPVHPIEAAMNAVGQDVLSRRESEVVAFILRGHSTDSIALHLDISPGTVKIHRKNAYSKLAISSQAELFTLLLDRLRILVPPAT
jgi:DNA-binding CsgD family transcriptional regulator